MLIVSVCCFYRPSILMCVPSCVRSVDQLSRHVQYSVNMSSQFTRTQKLSPVHSVLENSTPNTPSDVIWNNTGNFDVFLTVHHSIDFSKYQLNAQFLYSSTIYMLHYAHQHVSSSTLLIIRRTNCITTASGIVTLEIGERSYINKMRSAVLLKKYWDKSMLWCTVRKTQLTK